MTETHPSIRKLELRRAHGPVYRDVLNTPPRDHRSDEIPIIDLTRVFSPSLADRKALAQEIRSASVNTGFFYAKNHGIPDSIQNARKQVLNFFRQPLEAKLRVHKSKFPGTNDYTPSRMSLYAPHHDPEPKLPKTVPEDVKTWIRTDEGCWEGNSHLADFKKDSLAYWSACLTLARRLVQIFALALNLPEDYFSTRVTYPGADGVYNYYRPAKPKDISSKYSVGLGAHTDLQLFTLLWQNENENGGLQVLAKEGQWINAIPVPGTFVVNIGDFLMRLSNDLFESAVHREYNRAAVERVSMPFFFGLNFNCVQGVVPTCMSEDNPPKYEPMSCGDWCRLRFKQEAADASKLKGKT